MIIENKRIGECYKKIQHPSGLTILLYEMKGYSVAHAVFATKYGSVDCSFKKKDEESFIHVPAGIAHYLEHKLFEDEDCDAFVKFAKTGANANAFTSFDKTCYLFSTTENFKESLDILLNFVTTPYFTKESVQKEQGIIGQEIKMYEDNPDWRVFFNLLDALYVNHPVKLDIAGTIESISKIDSELLYSCYHTFYNLNNMVLAVAGNFDEAEVLEAADRILKKAEPFEIVKQEVEEPSEINKPFVQQNLPVAVPLFQIGFKETPVLDSEFAKAQVVTEILLELLAGESSELYRELYDNGLINSDFGYEMMMGPGYSCEIFSGESRDPQKVYDRLKQEIEKFKQQGIDSKDFELVKKAVYGRYIRGFNNVENIANALVSTSFLDLSLFDTLEEVAKVTVQDVNALLNKNFNASRSALSVVIK